jgi:hypothetical protein
MDVRDHARIGPAHNLGARILNAGAKENMSLSVGCAKNALQKIMSRLLICDVELITKCITDAIIYEIPTINGQNR